MSKLREQISLSSNDPSGIEEIKKVLSKDKKGECYKEIYSDDFNSINHDFQDPPGNNCLLIAIAAKKYKIAELLIEDAREKLTNEEFLEFINYRYNDPTKNSVRTNCYINTSLTLAAKHEQYELVQKLLNEGADPNGTDQYGFTVLTVLTMQLGLVSPPKNQQIVETIKLLQDKGADLNQLDKFERNASYYLEHDLNSGEIRGKIFTDSTVARILSIRKLNNIKELGETASILGSGATTADGAIYDSLHWGPGESTKKIEDYTDGRSLIKFDKEEKKLKYLTPKEFFKYPDKDYKKQFFQTEEGQNIKKEEPIIKLIASNVRIARTISHAQNIKSASNQKSTGMSR
ncbi:hypothetical protein [Rickettsia endosymbiont of Lasioglossum villosulum]|uniref:ankyrin repeat domain-containing protein n=1 Tax=Rickettsia endosymbiont of Lasioglossum villosulum TaxID=3066269 RepID=UPI003132C2C4